MKKVCFNFLVCKNYHTTRTKPLVQYLKSTLEKFFKGSKYFLIGGFDSVDDIEVIKLTDNDDYLSGIEKTLKIFDLHKDTNYDWYFIGDDDTFINFANLKVLLEKLSPEKLALYGCIDWAPTQRGTVLHAHGGAGILFNNKTFNTLKQTVFNTNFSIRHSQHGDVSLTLNALHYNDNNEDKIDFIKIQEMFSPHTDINSINIQKAVTVHTKDRVSFNELYKAI